MFSRLRTASLSLSEVLGGDATFEIPNFQRQYSWTIEHAGTLLEDLLEASGAIDVDDAQPDYFLGPVLFLEPGKDASVSSGEMEEYSNGSVAKTCVQRFQSFPGSKSILDGQQRLLTLTTLAAVVRDLDEGSDKIFPETMGKMIWCARTDQKEKGNEAGSLIPRIDLSNRFGSFLKNYVLQDGACRKIPPELDELNSDEASLFEVRQRFMHELMDLSQEERKSFADYLRERCHFLVASTNEASQAHIIFKRMNERGKSLESHDLLKADISSEISSADSDLINADWRAAQESLGPEFSNLFSHLRVIHGTTRGRALVAIRAIMHKVGGASQFVTKEIAPFAEIYHQIRLAQVGEGDLPDPIRSSLISLGRINGEEWIPPVLLALRADLYSPSDAQKILSEVERYAYLTRLNMLVVHKRRRRFAEITRVVRDGTVFDRNSDVFSLTREERRTVFYNLRELYVRSQKVCKAVLMRINDHMSGRSVVLTPSKYSVEHILPRRIKATSQWRKKIPDAELRGRLTHNIGNLVLVTEAQNQLLANNDFDNKRHILSNDDAQDGLQAITRGVLDVEEWDEDAILAREAQMLSIIKDIWRVAP